MAYEWQLTYLLLPFFAKHRLSEITVQEVDRYKASMIRRRDRGERLSNETINKTLVRLGQILEVAVEYELIGRNPAREKRRKLPVPRPQRSHLDAAYQIEALLDGASRLDAGKRSHASASSGWCYRRWCSQGCGSASSSGCGGETWTCPPGGSA